MNATPVCVCLLAITSTIAIGCGSPTHSNNKGQEAGNVGRATQSPPSASGSASRSTDEGDGDPGVVAATFDRDAAIDSARQAARQGDLSAASSMLREVLLVEPNDVEVVFLLANAEAAAGRLAEAIGLLDEIPADHPEAGLPALGQSADWCFQLERYDEAERRYRQVLEKVPQAVPASRQLAYLYNRQGRRHEAAQHIRELCKQGDVLQDELHALIVLGDAMYDDPSSPMPTGGTRPYWPIGASGRARKLFNQENFQACARRASRFSRQR